MSLIVRTERPLPMSLPVGTSTAVFCAGVCFHPDDRISDLAIVVDGRRHAPAAFGMPRPDVWREDPDRGDDRYHSGFWGTVPIPARDRPGTVEIGVVARLSSGRELTTPIGAVEVVSKPTTPTTSATPGRPGPGLIAICMATFEPDISLLSAQIESLKAQTDDRWICLISDDCSRADHLAEIVRVVGDDSRFSISQSDTRLGFYRNFERALRMVPAEAELVALCDQDDRWQRDKLRTLRESIGDSILAYSDLRLVEADGTVLRQTLWRERRNDCENMASMLVANTITGAAMLFRREMIEFALPFPDTPGFQFHDHWLAVVALATGEIAYVSQPLYDYVQHAGAVFGDVTHGPNHEPHSAIRKVAERLQRPGVRDASWRAAYFYGYLAREVQAQVVLARCGARLSPSKRRALTRFVACNSSALALAWLAGRSARRMFGRTETLGTEIELAQGLVWKRLAQTRARTLRRPLGALSDASFPPPQSFSQKRLRRWRARVRP